MRFFEHEDMKTDGLTSRFLEVAYEARSGGDTASLKGNPGSRNKEASKCIKHALDARVRYKREPTHIIHVVLVTRRNRLYDAVPYAIRISSAAWLVDVVTEYRWYPADPAVHRVAPLDQGSARCCYSNWLVFDA